LPLLLPTLVPPTICSSLTDALHAWRSCLSTILAGDCRAPSRC